jgi:hypothetical protein
VNCHSSPPALTAGRPFSFPHASVVTSSNAWKKEVARTTAFVVRGFSGKCSPRGTADRKSGGPRYLLWYDVQKIAGGTYRDLNERLAEIARSKSPKPMMIEGRGGIYVFDGAEAKRIDPDAEK